MLTAVPHQMMLLFFPAVMAMAAATDLLTMKIPNRLSAALAIGYFAAALLTRAPLHDVAMHALCGAAMLVFTFSLFSFGWIGGGDAKLAAATALWLGWTPLAEYGLTSALAGGALTLLILTGRRMALPEALASQAWIARLHNAKSGIPYGIALAFGGMLVYPETQLWGLLAIR
ncbi:MAG TPA: prepilin peptidase [Roseiarcus sp.]|nr:prepilin peptidase [Roseiarcus sp.]